jgi:hypothetical protein
MGTTADDLHRLADEAIRKGIRLYRVPSANEWYATSSSDPGLLHRVTALSCDCKGFMHWQRCTHIALLLAEIGYLPELPDPEPEPASPAAAAPVEDRPDPWDAPAVAAVPVAAPAANVVAFPSAEGRAAALAETVEASIGRLAAQLAEGRTEAFETYLHFVSRFHRYSARNTLLIAAQKKPDATLVAGMKVTGTGCCYRSGAARLRSRYLAPVSAEGGRRGDGEVASGRRAAPPRRDVAQLDGRTERPCRPPARAGPTTRASTCGSRAGRGRRHRCWRTSAEGV